MNTGGNHFARSAIAVATVSALGAWSGLAAAAGFAIQEQNASGLGNAFAGAAAVAEDASTIWFNPAGMTKLRGGQFVIAADAIDYSTKFSNSNSSLPVGQPANTLGDTGGDAGGWFFLPSAYLSWELSPNLWLGLGLNAPFALTTKWDSTWMGRFYAVKSTVQSANINPSIAWKVSEQFAVGAGFSAQYLTGEFSQAIPFVTAGLAGVQQLPAPLQPVVAGSLVSNPIEGTTTLKGNDWGWGWNIGMNIDFTPTTRLGLTYRSQINHTIKGNANASSVVYSSAVPAASAAITQGVNAAVASGPVQAEVKLPQSASVALEQQVNDRIQLLFDYTWTGWDSIQNLTFTRTDTGATYGTTPLNFRNSYRVGGGLNWQYTDTWKLRFGIAYDTTPVQDQFRTPRLPDANRTWYAIGAQYKVTPTGAIDFGYAYISVKSAPSELQSPAQGNLLGEYKAYINVLGVQYRQSF